jgi:hypothetical protein
VGGSLKHSSEKTTLPTTARPMTSAPLVGRDHEAPDYTRPLGTTGERRGSRPDHDCFVGRERASAGPQPTRLSFVRSASAAPLPPGARNVSVSRCGALTRRLGVVLPGYPGRGTPPDLCFGARGGVDGLGGGTPALRRGGSVLDLDSASRRTPTHASQPQSPRAPGSLMRPSTILATRSA